MPFLYWLGELVAKVWQCTACTKSIPQEKVYINKLCIPGSFNTNISHHLFDKKITFMNSQRKNKNTKEYFVLKTGFKRSF